MQTKKIAKFSQLFLQNMFEKSIFTISQIISFTDYVTKLKELIFIRIHFIDS